MKLYDIARWLGWWLVLNTTKTDIITTEAQAPSLSMTPAGLNVEMLSGMSTHQWLGCPMSRLGSLNSAADVEFHVRTASRVFLQIGKSCAPD